MILSGILDTGMSANEAVARAGRWWDAFGRHYVPQEFNEETTVRSRKKVKGFPAVILRDTNQVVPSGILHGKPFGELERGEQLQIAKAWHHFFVRVPQIKGELPPTTDRVLTIRCDSAGHPKATRDEEHVFRGRTQALCFGQAHEAGWLISSGKDICPECMAREYHPEPEGVQ